MLKPVRALTLLVLLLAACSGNDEAEALAADIRAANSPLVLEVQVDSGSWHEDWGVIVNTPKGTSREQAHSLWCEVILPAWDQRSLTTRWDNPSDRLTLAIFGTAISVDTITC